MTWSNQQEVAHAMQPHIKSSVVHVAYLTYVYKVTLTGGLLAKYLFVLIFCLPTSLPEDPSLVPFFD